MINCIAVDDEPLALQLLADNISKVPYLKLVECCEDAFHATRVLNENKIDLVFIDIQMPGLTGLQFIESMTFKPMFIIISAYKQYALEGFSLNVVDYLLKPVSLERFIVACNKARDLFLLKNNENPPKENAGFLFVNIGYSLQKVTFSDIEYIEGMGDYIKIYLKNASSPVVTRMGIKTVEALLPENEFLQVHKSFIIGINSITAIKKNSVFIGKREFLVGNTHKEAFNKFLSRFRL